MSRLSWNEAKILRAARDLMAEKPDETLTYLSGTEGVTNEHLISLALRAQLEQTKQAQNAMKVTVALVKFLKGAEDGTQAAGSIGALASVVEAPATVQAGILEGAEASNQTGEQA